MLALKRNWFLMDGPVLHRPRIAVKDVRTVLLVWFVGGGNSCPLVMHQCINDKSMLFSKLLKTHAFAFLFAHACFDIALRFSLASFAIFLWRSYILKAVRTSFQSLSPSGVLMISSFISIHFPLVEYADQSSSCTELPLSFPSLCTVGYREIHSCPSKECLYNPEENPVKIHILLRLIF